MDELDFTEEEIKEQLEKLGYRNVSDSRLKEFKRDLERLVQQERRKNSSCSTTSTTTNYDTTSDFDQPQPVTNFYRQPLNDVPNVSNHGTNHHMYDFSQLGKENEYRPLQGSTDVQSNVMLRKPTYAGDGISSTNAWFRRDRVDITRPQSAPPDTSFDTTTSSERRTIKRKVIRKRNGQSVYEESILDSETDDMNSIQDGLERLRIPDYRPPTSDYRRPTSVHSVTSRRPASAQSEPVYRLPEDYCGPTALIRPMTGDPHTRHIKKSDPVSMYKQYNQSWSHQRAPGEKSHKSLRWSVRESMLYHDQVVQKKQHKVGAPNKYVIPSDKKRKEIRWQVRQDLAQGIKPPSIFD